MEVMMLCDSDSDGQHRIALEREMTSIGCSPDQDIAAVRSRNLPPYECPIWHHGFPNRKPPHARRCGQLNCLRNPVTEMVRRLNFTAVWRILQAGYF
jgi:hypothetical protein